MIIKIKVYAARGVRQIEAVSLHVNKNRRDILVEALTIFVGPLTIKPVVPKSPLIASATGVNRTVLTDAGRGVPVEIERLTLLLSCKVTSYYRNTVPHVKRVATVIVEFVGVAADKSACAM